MYLVGPELEVYCTIDNCQWWADGNKCHASVILITHDAIGNKYPEEIDADDVYQIVAESGETPAEDCMETCCKTFTPKKE